MGQLEPPAQGRYQPPLILDDDSDEDLGPPIEQPLTGTDALATGSTSQPIRKLSVKPKSSKDEGGGWLPDMLEVIRTPETPRQLRPVTVGGEGVSVQTSVSSLRSWRSGGSMLPSTSVRSTRTEVSTRGGLRKVNTKMVGRRQHPKKIGPKNLKPKFTSGYNGVVDVKQIVEPDLRLQSWLDGFKTEQESFESIAVYAEAKLREVQSATAGLTTPNAYRTAVCCDTAALATLATHDGIDGFSQLLFTRNCRLLISLLQFCNLVPQRQYLPGTLVKHFRVSLLAKKRPLE